MRYKGRIVAVTGGASGIGEAIVIGFVREGANVALIDIDDDAANRVVADDEKFSGKVKYFPCDISIEEQVEQSFSSINKLWNRMDVLVNNAGVYFQGDVVETTLTAWQNILAVNLTGAFLCTKYAVQLMRKVGGGVIINVASEAGLVGIKGQVAYNVSKGGMIALTRSCAVDFAADSIRVNCVCPGTTETPLVRAAVNRAPDPAAARRKLEQVRPQNRLGKPHEIASAVLHLASDELAYSTGAILSIDGGYTAQ